MKPPRMKIGMGTDVHPLVPGRDLIIGGVTLDYPMGLAGHSDADVLIHAVCDALLGALGAGDIGDHFPDTDPRYRGIDSRILLQTCKDLLTQEGYEVGNLDCTVFAQAPKLGPRKQEMAEVMARILDLDAGCVTVKATTTEGLGFIGQKLGIAAQAIVMIQPISGTSHDSENL